MIAEAFITDGERWRESPTSQELKSFLNDSSGGSALPLSASPIYSQVFIVVMMTSIGIKPQASPRSVRRDNLVSLHQSRR